MGCGIVMESLKNGMNEYGIKMNNKIKGGR